MKPTTVDALLSSHRGLLLDAYGVLVDGEAALPGAAALIDRLETEQRPWLVLTNDASRLPHACAARYRALGVPVPDDRVLTSGSLLGPFLKSRGLVGAPCLVLGPPDSHAYVAAAGAVPVGPGSKEAACAAAVVIGDDSGFELRRGIDEAITVTYAAREAGRSIVLVVPNPDVVYPKRPGAFGMAAGSLALLVEAALELRYPGDPENRFVRLGKPAPQLFDEATARLGTRDVVMIGDQLATDVAGAIAAGLEVALLGTGVGRLHPGLPAPTYMLDRLD